MDAHDQETQQQKRTTADRRVNSASNSEDRNAPITVAENQAITAEHPA